MTKCQDRCKIKFLAIVTTGFDPGLATVNLESWHLTCSAPPTANGEALRQKAYARSVPELPILSTRSYSRYGTLARIRPSYLVRAFPDSVHAHLHSNRCTVMLHAGSLEIAANVILRAFRQMMVGLRNTLPHRPPVFLFS